MLTSLQDSQRDRQCSSSGCSKDQKAAMDFKEVETENWVMGDNIGRRMALRVCQQQIENSGFGKRVCSSIVVGS